MPLRMTEKYYEPVYEDMARYFYEFYWSEIFELIGESRPRFNSNSALTTAIREGRISYRNGVFQGSFNAKISRELSEFAKYDGRSKVWKGMPPADVKAAAVVANDRGEDLARRINIAIDEIPARVEAEVERLKYSIDAPLFAMSDQAGADLETLGISIDLSPELSQRLIDNYTNNQNINIKDWTPEQTVRLRDMIQENALAGYNRDELIQRIKAEYGTSMAKAKFLARQETSLFMAEVRDTRYQGAGIEQFRWSATGGKAGDGRTRPLHRMLHGQVFDYASPPIIDERTGERGVPGQAFGCRCVAIPVL